MNQTLVVGIDPHRKKNVMQLMDGQGQVLGPLVRVDNNRPGTTLFVKQVVEQMHSGGYERMQIASEATGWYWFHLFQSLSQDPLLNQWPVELYLFNPRLTAKFKQNYSDQDKTDPLDAAVVADRLRFGRDLPVPFRTDDTYLPLRCLTRYYFHLTHTLAREKAYALTSLYLKASDYTHSDKQPFANVFGAASQAVLQEFASIDQIAAIPFDDLVEFIDSKGKRRLANPANSTKSPTTPTPCQPPCNNPSIPSSPCASSTSPSWKLNKNGFRPPSLTNLSLLPTPSTPSLASARFSPLASSPKSVLSTASTSTRLK